MSRVSVIITTHNRCDLIKESITSVLGQTCQDFELLIVDDASTDNTAEAVSKFNDPRIRYIRHEENQGAAVARNTGIRNAQYDCIAFLDDDDEWLPEKLALQLEVLDRSGADVGCVYTGHEIIVRSTGELIATTIPTERGHIYKKMLEQNRIGTTSIVLIPKKCFDDVGLFDESLPYYEDYEMFLRIAKKYKIECVSQPLLRYYVDVFGLNYSKNLSRVERGLEIMDQRYCTSSSDRAVKNHYSRLHLMLGVNLFYKNYMQKGRAHLLRSLRLNPLEMRSYFNLCLSFLGTKVFTRIKQCKENLFKPAPLFIGNKTHDINQSIVI